VNQVSVPGDIVLGSDADLVIAANLVIDRDQQFSTGANVTVHKSGFLILNSNPSLGVPTPVVGTLSGSGGGVSLGPINGSLTVSNSTFCTFPSVISGSGKFIKDGPAKMLLTGNNTYVGNTVVNGGVLQVDGSQIQSAVQVNAGKLQGTGTVGPITMNASSAVVEPGNSPGILNCGNLRPGGAVAGYLNFELNGLTPGTGYDQLYVLGTVNLNGITLTGSLGFNSVQSNSFTIIQNDGTDPITGTFVGLPQNGTVNIGWQQFRISYTGGDGNDVVLTQISSNAIPACDPAPSGLVAWWPGDGNANDITGGNNGELQNGTAFVPGVVGQAFSFDGVDDQVIIPGFCNLLPTNEVTVEFWQKVGSVRSQFNFCPATPNGNNIFDVSGPWADGVFYWEFGNANTHAGQLAYTPTNSIIGTWQHFACVASQNGNYMKIYRNGVLEAQKPGMTPFVGTNEDFVLGGDAIHPYDGQLDEVSIYNRELNAAEILAIYNAGIVGKCLNAVYITSINRTGNTVDLTWLSQPGVTYRVQSNADLNSANWIDATGDITAASTSTSTSVSDAASQKYYRVEIQR
jgi:autotransporter-associated beta strand protein